MPQIMKCSYDVVPLTPLCSSLVRSTTLSSSCVSSEPDATKLEDWMYWQRDGASNPCCWTKVYAVLRNEFLWLYQREESAPKSLLLQLAVMSVEESGDRQLRIVDPNGEDIELCIMSDDALETWKNALQLASELTDDFFRSSCIDAKDLPHESYFRGTLVTYRRLTKRTRCKAALNRLAHRWKDYLERTNGESC